MTKELGMDVLVVPALAALVIRQAQQVMGGNRIVAGVDAYKGRPMGLSHDDRQAMAMVSRVLLRAGEQDHAAEIHELLSCCARPLGDWLPLAQVRDGGLSKTRLIDADEGVPTPEAVELALSFSGYTAGFEEILFGVLKENLRKLPENIADLHYTAIREFVIRHPLTDDETISDFAQKKGATRLPATLWTCLRHQFYEPVPLAWGSGGRVNTCARCGNALNRLPAGAYRCRTQACSYSRTLVRGEDRPQAGLLRVVRGMRQFWIEPGVDELRLYDELRSSGLEPSLYPHQDRVDILVGNVGIDLKAYSSPELLGMKLRKSIGGLAYYRRQFLVIPNWLTDMVPNYLDRLHAALEGAAPQLRLMRSSEVHQAISHA